MLYYLHKIKVKKMAERKIDNLQIFYVGSLIVSLIGAVLLFATDFANGWRYISYPSTISFRVFANDSVSGILVILMGILLIICALVALLALYKQELVKKEYVQYTMVLSLIVFIVSIVGLIYIAVEFEDYYWDPDAGFYGAIIGSLLTTIFLSLAWREM